MSSVIHAYVRKYDQNEIREERMVEFIPMIDTLLINQLI